MNLAQMFTKMRRILVRRIALVAAEAQEAFWMIVSGHIHSDLPMPEDFKDSFEWMVAKYIVEVQRHEQ